jgi:hypothetical protein
MPQVSFVKKKPTFMELASVQADSRRLLRDDFTPHAEPSPDPPALRVWREATLRVPPRR